MMVTMMMMKFMLTVEKATHEALQWHPEGASPEVKNITLH
jgi:hypothetical protein